MNTLTIFCIILGMGVLARMAGGGIGARHLDKVKLTWLPELLFAAPFGYCAYLTALDMIPNSAGAFWVGIMGAAWSYLWMQTGHGTAFHMGRRPHIAQGARKQTLSAIVDPICEGFYKRIYYKKMTWTNDGKWITLRWKGMGWKLGEWQYCWLFMGLKGVLIGLPAFPFGLILGVLWPAAYAYGHQKRIGTDEFLTGVYAGLVVVLVLVA